MASNSMTLGRSIFDKFNILFFILFSIVMIFPFWYVVNVSVSTASGSVKGGLFLLPEGFQLETYKIVLTSPEIGRAYLNTIFVTVVGTLLSVFISTATAFGISDKTMPGQKVVSFLIYFTMIFSGGLIPTYLVVKSLGLLDSLWVLILPVLLKPFEIIVIRSFFENLSKDVKEAAIIDGAGTIGIFFKICLPLSLPIVATVALWEAVSYWNEFFTCMIYIDDRKKKVLQLLLNEIISSQKTQALNPEYGQSQLSSDNVKCAVILVTTLPILCVYPFVQKYFVKGIMIGAVKG